jgi:Family of unknown function (DUF6328)
MAEGESPGERIDREFLELLNELRVVLPGVQILFAFMLTVPFNSAWTKATGFQRGLFYVALCIVAVSLASLLAPTAYHRLRFRDAAKERNLQVANRFIRIGLLSLGLAVTAVLTLIADYQFGTAAAVTAATFGLALFAYCWLLTPLADAAADRRNATGQGGEAPQPS